MLCISQVQCYAQKIDYFILASTVMRESQFWGMSQSSLVICSMLFAVLFRVPRPTSWYKPSEYLSNLLGDLVQQKNFNELACFRSIKRYHCDIERVAHFFCHTWSVLSNMEFFAWCKISCSLAGIVLYFDAKLRALRSDCSEMDGIDQKFKCIFYIILALILIKIWLLMFEFWLRLISQLVWLFLKLSL